MAARLSNALSLAAPADSAASRDMAVRPEVSTPAPERGLNWLALGLLLAAWNAASDDAGRATRPETLRDHPLVSVRALARSGELER